MHSRLAKPLHEVGGKAMLRWVIETARAAGCRRILVVVSPDSDTVRRHFPTETWSEVEWVVQAAQRGTGDAVAQAAGALAEAGNAPLLVLSGDVPLVTAATLERLLAAVATGSWGALAVADLDDPGSLGRVLTREDGSLERIVEAADASVEELAVRCINAGLYALPAPEVFRFLETLETDNAQGEVYLTDALGAAVAAGRRLALVHLDDPSEAWGVNSRQDLTKVHLRFLERAAEALMAAGVTLLDPRRTAVEPSVRVGRDTVIHPGVTLLGETAIGEGCTLHQGAWLRDSQLGDDVTIQPYTVLDKARVAARSTVGPFARLRPGSRLDEGVKVGNFVEVKNAHLETGAKAGHLAYLGDATVGAEANIGAGVVTCNYDGERKHRTVIGAGAFVGSDTMLVAPVEVAAGATTAAGSVITQDVPEGALGVARQRQRNIPGWTERKKHRNDATQTSATAKDS